MSSNSKTTRPKKDSTAPASVRDTQVGGDHYRALSLQPWDAMEAWMSREEFIGHLRCCALKYQIRYRDKGGVEDLKKARHYLDKLIEVESRPD